LHDALPIFVERLRFLRRSGVAEAWPISSSRIGDERELTHHERLAVDVQKRAVETALVVLEDAQLSHFRGQAVCCGTLISTRHSEQNAEPRADLAGCLLPRAYPRP